MFYEKTTLPNGMTVITEKLSHVRSISLGIWFNVGSRDEASDEAGLSHFMEHMMFKGTKTKGPLDISMHFDRLGAELNAFTSKEYTCYYSRFVDEKLEDALSVLAEMVMESVFAQDAIDTEREVVIEEIARSEDAPDDHVFEVFSKFMLPNHSLGLPVLGNRARVGSYEQVDCIEYHDKHYHAGNVTIAAAGNVDHEALVALVGRLFAVMQPGTKCDRQFVQPRFQTGTTAVQRDIEQAHIVYGFPWMKQTDPRRFAGTVLTSILGGSMSSRLFQEVREKRGLAYAIYATQALYQDLGQWCIYAGTRPENIGQVTNLISDELQRIANDALDADEFNRNIELICGQLLLGLETTNSRMMRLGKRETLGLDHPTPEESIEQYRALTCDDVQSLARELLTGKPCIAVVSPESEETLCSIIG